MEDKRNILISANTKEEFEKIEALLDNFYNSFLNRFTEVKFGALSDSLQFKTKNAGRDGVVLPEAAKNVSIKWGQIDSETPSSKIYTSYIYCSITINGEDQYISMETEGYYEIKEIKSSNILKPKENE